jgi:hypothetical protein
MTLLEAKKIYCQNFGFLQSILDNDPEAFKSFVQLQISDDVILQWREEIFQEWFPKIDNLPLSFGLRSLYEMATTLEEKVQVVDYVLSPKHFAYYADTDYFSALLLGQPSPYVINYYYGIVPDSYAEGEMSLVRKYAAIFADFAFNNKKEIYDYLMSLISFNICRKSGLDDLYLPRADLFDKEKFLAGVKSKSIWPFFALLAGFATPDGKANKEKAKQYLESLNENFSEPDLLFLKSLTK